MKTNYSILFSCPENQLTLIVIQCSVFVPSVVMVDAQLAVGTTIWFVLFVKRTRMHFGTRHATPRRQNETRHHT